MKNLLQKIGIGVISAIAGMGIAYGIVASEKKDNKTKIHFGTTYPGGEMKTYVWINDNDSLKTVEIKAEDVTLFEEEYTADSREKGFHRDISEEDIPPEGIRGGVGCWLTVAATDLNGNYSSASKWHPFFRKDEKELLSKYGEIDREREEVEKLRERVQGAIDEETHTSYETPK